MPGDLKLLQDEIRDTLAVLARLRGYYEEFARGELAQLGKTRGTAMIAGKLFESYYTCLETLFLRVSQCFENQLSPDRWHSDLLHKMRLRIEGVREPLLSERTYAVLVELLRFRHFSRYYYELDYDWDRIDFLRSKLEELDPAVRRELGEYIEFLKAVEPPERG